MLDLKAMFSQLWFLIPISIIVVILKNFIKKYKRKDNYSEIKKEIEKQNNNFEDIRRHNKEYFNSKKEKRKI
ncbi:MAG: hypothetical protein WBF48_12235 [Halarcobacter sp.]